MKKKILITGGAGFIGCNTAKYFMNKPDYDVIVFDNLSRKGTDNNMKWLQQQGGLSFIKGDIRNYTALENVFNSQQIDIVLHLAAQVAVTTSIIDPREDFEINAMGTFNLLEAIRKSGQKPLLLYTSTNKVYGGLEDVGIEKNNGAYTFRSFKTGMPEARGLDFHSPYGCSKGAADQYVRDYYRIYGIPTVVLRQSCIYGYRQFGIEDQGWVAWFMIAAKLGKNITVYGDGRQVRDILFIDDLVALFESVINHSETAAGQIYNIGGGPANCMSLLELLTWLEHKQGIKNNYSFSDWRAGDQPVYFSDIDKARKELDWTPNISKLEGMQKLYHWIDTHVDEIKQTLN